MIGSGDENQKEELRWLFQCARRRIVELNTEIRLLSAHLERLHSDRDDVQKILDKVIYPVLTLPIEITREIFLHCLPNRGNQVATLSRKSAPMVLGWVCAQWRRIALSMSTLWSSVDLTLHSRSPEEYDFLRSCLSRSGSFPLTLELSYQFDEGQSKSAGDFIDIITRHAYHLEDAKLWLPRADLVRLFDGCHFHEGFPILKQLQVFDTTPEVGVPPCQFLALKRSPDLRYIVSDGKTLHPRVIQIPWTKLARIEGYALSRLQACEILVFGQYLEECSLEFAEDPGTEISTPFVGIGILPHLKTLKLLKGINRSGDHGIFASVTLPALREL
ncbi:hypothetical protein C8R43DRAFT_879824, partial [Mycena crocata]